MNKFHKIVIALMFLIAFVGMHDNSHKHTVIAQDGGPLWEFVSVGQSNMNLIAPYLEQDLKDYYGPNVILVNTAVNGSSIESWQPGTINYNNSVDQANYFRTTYGYTVKAIFMDQGEYDAEFSTSSNWGYKAANFLNSYRMSVGNTYAYVIYTKLGVKPITPDGTANPYGYWEVMWLQQHNLRYNRPTFFMVDTSPYSQYDAINAPWAHYVPASRKLIADQMAKYAIGWVSLP